MMTTELDAMNTIRLRLCADVPAVACDVAAVLASQRADGSWADVEYANDHLKDWDPARHLARLQAMAQALYQTQDTNLLSAVLRGLDYWYARNPLNPNWWWNQIGAPQYLAQILLLLKDHCDASYITRAVPAFTRQEPTARFTGQNLVWTAAIVVAHGLLTDDAERVRLGLQYIDKEVRVFPDDEGLQADMSFHQHEKLLYSGGYGAEFARDIGRWIAATAGTQFAFPEVRVARFAAFILDGSRWMVRGNTFDPGAIGREISRHGHSAERFIRGLRYLAQCAHPRQAEAQASAAIDPAAGRSMVTGNRHFWASDLMVQHRPGYYLSARVPSPRVLNADWACCGGEGRLCHHMAEGATFVMRDGDEYRDIYPVWNWRQIPGTTVAQEAGDFDPDKLRGFGAHAFAGGASDGSVGCMAMDFLRDTLTARKAWFLFDEGLVALGAGITAESDDPVRTTLNQCHWRGPARLAGIEGALLSGDYPLAPGAAFWHDGVTYRILDGAGSLRLGAQSGAWSDCGVESTEVLTLPVLNAGLDHGVRPCGVAYAYALLPDVPAETAFTDDPARFVILRNDVDVQAVWHAEETRGHAVFYTPGTITFPDGQQLAVDAPCIVLYHPKPDAVSVTLADPTQQLAALSLRMNGGIETDITLQLPAGDAAGSSLTTVWQVTR